ncbi:unnamed protein product [Sympodiomycopsis kandeliae]
MRSRVIQPRALFRIAGGGVNTGGSTSSSAAAASSPLTPASASASVSSSSASSSSAACLRNPAASKAAFASRAGISSLARQGSKSSTTGSNSSSNEKEGASVLGGKEGKQGSLSSSSKNTSRQQPVIPVHPPPHSSKSVALQSFFSQGRPLLEHNNLDGNNGSPTLQLPSGHQQQQSALSGLSSSATKRSTGSDSGAAIAMVVEIGQEGSEVTGGEIIDASDRDSLLAQLKSQGGEEFTDEELEEATEKVAEMLRETGSSSERMTRLVQLGGQTLSSTGQEGLHSFPEEMQLKIREKAAQLMKSMENIGDSLGQLDLSKDNHRDALSANEMDALAVSLHLPSLHDVDQSAFEKVLNNVSSSPTSTSPLQMHTQIRTQQMFDKSRRELINEARMNGEDVSLASALGPESELMVLGEPSGPQKEWGRGVTSWLARYGRPYEAPSAPVPGSEASRLQRLEDMTAFELSDDSSAQKAMHESEDPNLWLGHALVQNKISSSLEWSRLVSLMDSNNTSPSDRLQANIKLLNATLPTSTLTEILQEKETENVVNMDSVKRKRKKKMRKMKYKKLRKRQRAERLRMKK